jgi:hypothetical protein
LTILGGLFWGPAEGQKGMLLPTRQKSVEWRAGWQANDPDSCDRRVSWCVVPLISLIPPFVKHSAPVWSSYSWNQVANETVS